MITVIEGVDGCGKSTMGKRMAELFNAELVEFPCDDTKTGPMIRQYLARRWWLQSDDETLDSKIDLMGAMAFQCMQLANRMEVLPRLDPSRNWVFVRYWQSGFVYGGLDGLEKDWLLKIHAGLPVADMNILLDLPAKVAMERRAKRDGDLPPERYEGKLAFTSEVVEAYRNLWQEAHAEHFPGRFWTGQHQWVTIDANQELEKVWDDVRMFV